MATSPVLPSGAAAQRRALIRHYKDNPPPMGVYAVRCDARRTFLVHGEPAAQEALTAALAGRGLDVYAPAQGETIELTAP